MLMKPLCWLLCCGLVCFSACRKKRDATPLPPEPPPSTAVGEPVPSETKPATAPAPPAAARPAEKISVSHFNQLSQALLTFKRDKQRGPKGWDELLATGYLKQMPTPPPGNRYIFDPRSLDVHMVPER